MAMIKAALWAVLLGMTLTSTAQSACTATPLSRAEAEHLLMFTPAALGAKSEGGRLGAVDWEPGVSYRHDLFYFFQLVSSTSNPTTPFVNPNLGYYAVNKITGRVVNGTTEDPIEDTALAKIQATMRVKHCISPELVRKNQAVEPTE